MDKNKQENLIYKECCERSYRDGSFCAMRYEKQMDYLFSYLKKDFENRQLRVLDACCGYGRLVHFLNKLDGGQEYYGIDYSDVLIDSARKRFKDASNVSFETANVFCLPDNYYKKFDITINYKTLSWLPYYEECMRELVRVTKDKIYITSLFNDGDYESITKLYQNKSVEEGSFTYLNTYSLNKFRKYVESLGAKVVDVIPMHLDFDLSKPIDINKIETYTISTLDNSRLEITANTILNWKLLVIKSSE